MGTQRALCLNLIRRVNRFRLTDVYQSETAKPLPGSTLFLQQALQLQAWLQPSSELRLF